MMRRTGHSSATVLTTSPMPDTTKPTRRMRVVYLDHTAKLSGGEIALLRLLPHLDEVEPHVILAEDGPLRLRLEESGISVEVLPMPAGSRDVRKDHVRPGIGMVRPLFDTVRYAGQVARRVRALKPDLVHTNSLKAGVYGGIAARLTRTPVVWHVRDRIAEDYLPKPAVRGIRLLLHHLPAAVIVNSRATLETIGTGDPVIVHSVVPELIDIGDGQTRPPRDATFRAGMVGRLAPWKGQDLFLQAFAAAFPDGNERAVIVGAAMFGEDDFADELEQLVATLGLAERVEFRGFCEDVPAELARLDVLVHASRTAEPFGQVVLEGLASSVPVIASEGGGPSEIVTPGINGLLFARGDQRALTRHLVALRTDERLRAELVIGGLARARDFSPQLARLRVQDLYRQVLAR